MPSILKQYPEHQECGLPYHREGSRVKWTRYSRQLGHTITVTGVVLRHDHRVISARMDHSGQIEMTSCGCVVAE